LSEKCSEVLAEIEAFVDGELPKEKVPEFVEHLEECPPCLERADFQAKLKQILRSKCQRGADPSETFVLRIRHTIRTEVRSPTLRSPPSDGSV
jgi:anti-sigma factor (TIGR02949 family)